MHFPLWVVGPLPARHAGRIFLKANTPIIDERCVSVSEPLLFGHLEDVIPFATPSGCSADTRVFVRELNPGSPCAPEAVSGLSRLPTTRSDEDSPACNSLCPSKTTFSLACSRVASILAEETDSIECFLQRYVKCTIQMMLMVLEDIVPSTI